LKYLIILFSFLTSFQVFASEDRQVSQIENPLEIANIVSRLIYLDREGIIPKMSVPANLDLLALSLAGFKVHKVEFIKKENSCYADLKFSLSDIPQKFHFRYFPNPTIGMQTVFDTYCK
tara:strand:+ start:181 stop:537 length:357 start_codon:yes stop_codon:yes gene_type:complete